MQAPIELGMPMQSYLLLALAGLALATVSGTVKTSPKDDSIQIGYYYSADNGADGDFLLYQLIPELEDTANNLQLFALPYGGIEMISDDNFKYYCHGKKGVCETSQLQYCLQWEFSSAMVPFLSCYFQNELFSVDLLGATKQCIAQLGDQVNWTTIETCTEDEWKLDSYIWAVSKAQQMRPLFYQTPHVYLNDEYSALAAIDLKKALCRAKTTDIWQCESVDQYKEPLLDIFYTVYEQETTDFFAKQFTQVIAQNVINTVSRLELIPNPNNVIGCDSTEESCWNHQAHYCIFNDYSGLAQLEIIQCTFGKSSSVSGKDRVRQCVPDGKFQEILNCITTLGGSTAALTRIRDQLNLKIDRSQQTAVEVLVKGQSNVKAKSDVLSELCDNYFHVDDETLGCKVTKKKVQVFYETGADGIWAEFGHFIEFAQLAPFETIAQFEFIPYGMTSFVNGSYECTGGDDQCKANWIHACLLKEYYNTIDEQFQFLQFFLCTSNFAGNDSMVERAEQCLNQNYINGPSIWSQLLYCANMDNALKEELRTKTEAIDSLTQIPEIIIDSEKKTDQEKLLYALCVSFDGTKPRACQEIETIQYDRLKVSVYLTGDTATQQFVQSQIKPLLTSEPRDASLRLRDVIEWTFVPWGPSQYNSTSGEIVCATGANECLVNRILTCSARQKQNGLLGNREDRLRVVSFLVCFFDSANWQDSPLDAANQCAGKLSPLDSFPSLWQCTQQNSKQEFVLEMKNRTENNYPTISKFPEVAIDAQRQMDISDLKKTLCLNYQALQLPVECRVVTVPPTSPNPITTPISIPSTTPTPGGKALANQVSCLLLTFTMASLFVLYQVS